MHSLKWIDTEACVRIVIAIHTRALQIYLDKDKYNDGNLSDQERVMQMSFCKVAANW